MRIPQKLGLALGAGLALAAGVPAPATAGSWLYPPEVRARIVVVVPGIGLQRRYWDPRYCAFYSVHFRQPWQCPASAGYGQWYFSF
jgi:hypothetical protein